MKTSRTRWKTPRVPWMSHCRTNSAKFFFIPCVTKHHYHIHERYQPLCALWCQDPGFVVMNNRKKITHQSPSYGPSACSARAAIQEETKKETTHPHCMTMLVCGTMRRKIWKTTKISNPAVPSITRFSTSKTSATRVARRVDTRKDPRYVGHRSRSHENSAPKPSVKGDTFMCLIKRMWML